MKLFRFLYALLISCLMCACANRGAGPQGGAKDLAPPRVLRSVPESGATNIKSNRVEIRFDELVAIDRPSENIIFSPPPVKPPTVDVTGRAVKIAYNDPMRENTTYTIDFGNAIADSNENNILYSYAFAFSTGATVDSLQIAGTVLNAADLNPMSSVFVGVHTDLTDTAFVKMPFLRVSKTDEKGNFRITNLPQGRYRVFALNDKNRSFSFDNPAEDIAWNDSLVTPSQAMVERPDTIWKDSLTVDSVVFRKVAEFQPSNLVLRLFNEGFKRQYLAKSERTDKTVSFSFNAPQEKLPEIKALNFDYNTLLLQKSPKNDTLVFWLKDSAVYTQDTLKWQITYLKTQLSGKDSLVTDTVKLTLRGKKKPKKADEITALKFKTNLSGKVGVDASLFFDWEEPVQSVDASAIKLFQKADTLWTEKPVALERLDEIGRFALRADLEPENSYRLQMDSAAIQSIYGKVTDKYESKFQVRALDEYATFIVTLEPFRDNMVLQLLTNADKVVKEQKAAESETVLEYIEPGTYYLRLFVDENGNGVWDTGNYESNRQPEPVYYFGEPIQLRANWDVEIQWSGYADKPLTEQKPTELKKDGNKR